jgi:hypothetical protein
LMLALVVLHLPVIAPSPVVIIRGCHCRRHQPSQPPKGGSYGGSASPLKAIVPHVIFWTSCDGNNGNGEASGRGRGQWGVNDNRVGEEWRTTNNNQPSCVTK